ncbi:MAG: UvrD-helicase domain-containing protein, partial [Halobacteriaceae archaeon]
LLQNDDLEPEDILLITFTDNAASEMKDRVVAHCDYSMSALRDAPINTFHSYCNELLMKHGFRAPTKLGIDDRITSSTHVLEDDVIESEKFREYITQFIDNHPEYHDYFRIIRDTTSLLDIIKELAAKGVFPTANGWFRNSETYLDGDFDTFKQLFEEANEPNEGVNSLNQSDLRSNLSGFDRDRTYLPGAPSADDIRDGYPQIDERWAQRAFEEDRDELKAFIHDLYFEYIEFALSRNYLNFSFLLMFAFALLCEDHSLRDEVQFEHIMVDEFQDTSEIQFKLAMILAGTNNICVVGDWKQSIFGFQYADVDNIRRFKERLHTYKTELNDDAERISYPIDDITEIALVKNYRSTQSILDFSECSLTLPATKSEDIDPAIQDEITKLEATTEHNHSTIEAFTGDDEYKAILTRVQDIVGNQDYAVEDEDGDLRDPSYDDIAILTRTRRFGRELQNKATEFNIPVAYEGGVELFSTNQAILLLAWLRILENEDSERGWSVVLEKAGYNLDEVKHILDTSTYPSNMVEFRDRLEEAETIGAVARNVFEKYGFDDAYADTLVAILQETFNNTNRNRGDIIRFIEDSLESDATHEVDDNPGGDSITVQTIHAAKGLEHPIVILANINQYSFPPSGGNG